MKHSRVRIITDSNTARNPIARAIARKKVHDRLLSAKVRIYMLDRGADDSDQLGALMLVMGTVGRALELEYPDDSKMPIEVLRDTRVLRGGLSALNGCWTRWDPAQAVAVEQAIDAAERLNRVAKVEHLYDAGRDFGIVF
jgi:hypothetical protein